MAGEFLKPRIQAVPGLGRLMPGKLLRMGRWPTLRCPPGFCLCETPPIRYLCIAKCRQLQFQGLCKWKLMSSFHMWTRFDTSTPLTTRASFNLSYIITVHCLHIAEQILQEAVPSIRCGCDRGLILFSRSKLLYYLCTSRMFLRLWS